MGRVIAEYKGEDSNSIVPDRSYLHGNGYNEILGMFLPDPDSYVDSNDVDWLVGFSDEWLCQSNCSYDEDSDGDVDFVDFAKHLDEDEWNTVFPGSNTHYYYLKDALGSVACVIDGQSNNPEDREFYLYDAYGKPADSSNESASGNPYGFAGMRYDGEIGLYHTLTRMYDPEIGRAISADIYGLVPNADFPNKFEPIEQYPDGLNKYEWVMSNPVNVRDDWGLESCNIYVACGKLKETDSINIGFNVLGMRHCEYRIGNAPSGREDEVFYRAWKIRNKSKFINAGQGRGKSCSCATCGDVKDCLLRVYHMWNTQTPYTGLSALVFQYLLFGSFFFFCNLAFL